MEIHAFTFDVGGTLVDGRLDQERYQQRLLDYLRGLEYTGGAKRFRRVMGQMLAKLQRVRQRDREVGFVEFYSELLVNLGIEPSDDVLEQIRVIYRDNFPQREIPGAREAIERLADRFKLGVISNTMTGISRRFLHTSGLSAFFDVIVLSCDVGIRKPDPRIFLYTLKRLGVEPVRAVHVGDSLTSDVVGALRAGMYAAWIARERPERVEIGYEPDFIVGSIVNVIEVAEALEPPHTGQRGRG